MISFVLTHNKKRQIHLAFTICLFKNALWNICKKFANFLCGILDYLRLWCKLDASKKEYYLCALERVNHKIHWKSYNKFTADDSLENFWELQFFLVSKEHCFKYLNTSSRLCSDWVYLVPQIWCLHLHLISIWGQRVKQL